MRSRSDPERRSVAGAGTKCGVTDVLMPSRGALIGSRRWRSRRVSTCLTASVPTGSASSRPSSLGGRGIRTRSTAARPSALLARAIERHEPGPATHVARLTIELLRPVPLGQLEVRARTIRPGKKVQLVEAAIAGRRYRGGARRRLADPREAARSPRHRFRAGPARNRARRRRAIRVRARRSDRASARAMEIAPVRRRHRPGRSARPSGSGSRVPLVAGEETSPLMRVAAAADFGNGVSAVVDWNSGWMFINPDLTIYLSRYPVSEWVAIEAVTYPVGSGCGLCRSGALRRERPHRSIGPEPPVRPIPD